MLITHNHRINKDVWIRAGTTKEAKYISVNSVVNVWDFPTEVAQSLLPFHALTGSNSTSFLAGHSKKTTLKIFLEIFNLLSNLGRDSLTKDTLQDCENFICKIYNAGDVATTNEARTFLFKRGLKAELLPPTSDAVEHHIMRSHHQSMIWL